MKAVVNSVWWRVESKAYYSTAGQLWARARDRVLGALAGVWRIDWRVTRIKNEIINEGEEQ
jgi:hypothetical protein